MDDREKLAELLYEAMIFEGSGRDLCEKIADHLIANGVTVQEWVSVTERLPQGADGKSLCENVIAYLNNGAVEAQVCSGWLNGDKWYLLVGYEDYHTVWGLGAVTHWTPLPVPPKE